MEMFNEQLVCFGYMAKTVPAAFHPFICLKFLDTVEPLNTASDFLVPALSDRLLGVKNNFFLWLADVKSQLADEKARLGRRGVTIRAPLPGLYCYYVQVN